MVFCLTIKMPCDQLMKCFLLRLISINLFITIACLQQKVEAKPEVPCFFIFGDSLSDSGNNNILNTTAKVNFPPYGVDFPSGRPTGRFSNGRTSVDVIGQLLGFEEFIPPFPEATSSNIETGVNYASGGCGIRDETGRNLGGCFPMSAQLKNHRTIISRLVNKLGSSESAFKLLNKCLYHVNAGSNDFINNYFMPNYYPTSKQYTPEQYAEVLVQQLSQQITTLYELGARKFVINELGAIGCSPNAVYKYGEPGAICVPEMQHAVSLFNGKLKPLVDRFNNNNDIPESKLALVKTSGFASVLSWSPTYSLSHACCTLRDDGLCIPNQAPCEDRLLQVYWDSFHPTETVNEILGILAYSHQNLSIIYPLNIKSLVQL